MRIRSGTDLEAFLWKRDGTITTFDVPGSTSTNPASINPAGLIAGWYWDANGVSHGFLRKTVGAFDAFDVPGATQTSPSAINPAGLITGTYSDANFVQHGFRARP